MLDSTSLPQPNTAANHSGEPTRAPLLELAQQTLDIEAASILSLKSRIGEDFLHAVSRILNTKGRLVVMGIGKSGHVGRKIAATFASTGTPAFFVHPAEASHGDLGMITRDDTVLAISNSGESSEITTLLPLIKRLGVFLLVMSGYEQSNMAQIADIWLSTQVEKEACPLNLAPTASTIVQMALGDALAMCVLEARGFRIEDFAKSHPGGALGRKLLTHVKDIMRPFSKVPRVPLVASFTEVLHEMSQKGLGATAIVNENGMIAGIFTDGDLRRLLEQNEQVLNKTAQEIMHPNPHTILDSALAVDAAALMEQNHINSVLVVNAANQLVGAISTNDLMQAKVI